jgi:hypothetical protein
MDQNETIIKWSELSVKMWIKSNNKTPEVLLILSVVTLPTNSGGSDVGTHEFSNKAERLKIKPLNECKMLSAGLWCPEIHLFHWNENKTWPEQPYHHHTKQPSGGMQPLWSKKLPMYIKARTRSSMKQNPKPPVPAGVSYFKPVSITSWGW